MKTLICDCNRSLPLDTPALMRALAQVPGADPSGLERPHSTLCRREAPAFQRAAKETTAAAEALLVCCTQEERLFLALNAATEGAAQPDERPIRFVNLREQAGWAREGAQATPKMAALIAAAQMPAPPAVATVGYRSNGRLLIVGPAEPALQAVAALGGALEATLLVTEGALPQQRDLPQHAGRLRQLKGHLGAFEAEWEQGNPIDLDLCTRCNACIKACPEGAIDFSYQVDLAACRSHRACVTACEVAGAIDFSRAPVVHNEAFDLVLDVRPTPAFTQTALPEGYLHSHPDRAGWAQALTGLIALQGQFDKPRFLTQEPRLCAHSRSERIGCTACIDVCSASAIRSDASLKGKLPPRPQAAAAGARPGALPLAKPLAGGVVVDAHLCVGCGACTTVCPTGSLRYTYPPATHQAQRVRTMLQAYRAAGGRDAALLLHSEGSGQALIQDLGRSASVDPDTHGLPARVLPLALWHSASTGLELWLGAIADGASQVWVLSTDDDAESYRSALDAQMAIGQAVLTALGYSGQHLRRLHARDARDLADLDRALQQPPAQGVREAARAAASADKRQQLDQVLAHLIAQAPDARALAPDAAPVALPAGAPWGRLAIDADRCTLCLSCVSACPPGALGDNPERPQLRFTESACVQCGLCASTCPEKAITLQPALWLADGGKARQQQRLLHEVPPFACVRCGKPFGTLKAIEAMIGKLAGHAAFQGAASERLKMCGDCRVIDLHSNPNEVRITDL